MYVSEGKHHHPKEGKEPSHPTGQKGESAATQREEEGTEHQPRRRRERTTTHMERMGRHHDHLLGSGVLLLKET